MDRQVHACEVLLKQKLRKKRALSVCEELEVHVKFKDSHFLPRPSTSSPHSSSSPIDPVGNTRRSTFHMLLSLNLDMYANTPTREQCRQVMFSHARVYPGLCSKKKGHRLLNADQTDVTHGRVNPTSGVHRIIQLSKHHTPHPPPYQNILKRSGAGVDSKGRGGGNH